MPLMKLSDIMVIDHFLQVAFEYIDFFLLYINNNNSLYYMVYMKIFEKYNEVLCRYLLFTIIKDFTMDVRLRKIIDPSRVLYQVSYVTL